MGGMSERAMELELEQHDDSGYDAYCGQQAEAKLCIEMLGVDAVSAIRRLTAAALHEPLLAQSEHADVIAAVRELQMTIAGKPAQTIERKSHVTAL